MEKATVDPYEPGQPSPNLEETLVRALEKRGGKVEVAQVDLEQEMKDLVYSSSSPRLSGHPMRRCVHRGMRRCHSYMLPFVCQVRELKTRIEKMGRLGFVTFICIIMAK